MSPADQLEITRLRTEIAFLRGDERIGGPNHECEIEALRARLRDLSGNGRIREDQT